MFRKDRDNRASGGVCLFVSNELSSSNIQIKCTAMPSIELIGCNIHIGRTSLQVFCFYCTPNVERALFLEYLKCLSLIFDDSPVARNPVLILGDFNLPHIR